MSKFKYPIQMLYTDLRIVDSNGDIYYTQNEIKEVCEKLSDGTLSGIDVYDSGPVEAGFTNPVAVSRRICSSVDFTGVYGNRIESAYSSSMCVPQSNSAGTSEQLAVEACSQPAFQADAVYYKPQITSADKCLMQNVPVNPSCELAALAQVYAPVTTQNFVTAENLNVPVATDAKSAKHTHDKKPYNAAIEAEKLLKCVKIVNYNNAPYIYTNTYYKLLDKSELQKIIYTVLKDDIIDKGTFSYVDDIYKFVITSAEKINFEKSNIGNKVMFANCTVNIDTLSPEQHSPYNYNTHALSVPFVPYENLNAPNFSKYVFDLAGGNQILIQRIWEALGLLLSNDIKAKRIVLLVGKGNTGKSIFGKVVRELIADGNVTSFAPQKLTERFIGTSLANSAVNICMDLQSVPIDPATAAVLKNLSGGDIVSGEVKYMNNFSYIYQGHLLFGSNYPIRLNYKDQAFAERLLIIPCENPIPRHLQDTSLLEKIIPELPVIAGYAVMCFASVRKNHYAFSGDDVYSVNDDDIYVKAPLKTEFENSVDYSVEYFARQMCELTSEDKFVISSELYNEYRKFCTENCLDAVINSNTFSKLLHNILPNIKNSKKRVGGSTVNVWHGIALKK